MTEETIFIIGALIALILATVFSLCSVAGEESRNEEKRADKSRPNR